MPCRDKAVGVFYDIDILAIPEGDSTENNCILDLRFYYKNWTIKRGFNVNDFLYSKMMLAIFKQYWLCIRV